MTSASHDGSWDSAMVSIYGYDTHRFKGGDKKQSNFTMVHNHFRGNFF